MRKIKEILYHDLFGLDIILDNDENVILTEGLVLQDEKSLGRMLQEKKLSRKIIPVKFILKSGILEDLLKKLEKLYPEIKYVTRLMTDSWGQKVIRFMIWTAI